MKWNKHSELEGQHAFLGASSYHWINYSDDKIATAYKNRMATLRGTELHDFASRCIKLKQNLPRSQKTLNMFVNDAIGIGMDSELILYYSDNAFGTADAIYFGKQPKTDRLILRIHDLKTGDIPAHMEQLIVYASLFCLEYNIKPGEIDMELRIYQNNDILYYNPEPDAILPVMDKIKRFDRIIEEIKRKGE